MIQTEAGTGYRIIPKTNKMMEVTYNYLKHTSKSRFRQWTIENLNKALVKSLRSLRENSVVDVGCGEGFTLNRLRKEKIAKRFLGIDSSSAAINLGWELFPELKLEVHDIYDLPLHDNSFDVVVCTEVLEHLNNPGKALNELIRVSGKYLALSVPNEPFFSFKNLLMGKNINRLGSSVQHINWWTSKAFLRFVSKKNVNILDCSYPFPFTLVLLKKR